MNLESIERVIVKMLSEAENPLVPIDRIYRTLDEQMGAHGMSRGELVDFIDKHELFKVLETPGRELGGVAEALIEAGMLGGPYAILETRVPSRAQLREQMRIQLALLADALTAAAREAQDQGNTDRVEDIKRMLQRLTDLSHKLG